MSYGISLYPDLALTNHSCIPNAIFIKRARYEDMQSNAGVIRATPKLKDMLEMLFCILRDVREGEELNITYIPLKRLTTEQRRQQLYKSWFFRCQCAACRDLTEIERYAILPVIVFNLPLQRSL